MSGEASIGSFDVSDWNDGWHISAWSADGDEISLEEGDEIRLPCRPDLPLGTDMLLTNTLPEGIKDGMQLSFRTAMEDVEISIAGKLRSSYISEELPNKDYYLPSAYVVVELYDDDAGQEIEIHVKNKSTPVLNGVTLGYGANVWSPGATPLSDSGILCCGYDHPWMLDSHTMFPDPEEGGESPDLVSWPPDYGCGHLGA